MKKQPTRVDWFIGYTFNYILAVVTVAIGCLAGLWLAVGVISFALWELPEQLPGLTALRVCLMLGMFLGIFWLPTKECKESIIEAVNDE